MLILCCNEDFWSSKLYAIGGRRSKLEPISLKDKMDVYNIATQTWSLDTNELSMSTDAFTSVERPSFVEHCTISHKNKLYVIGGVSGIYTK